MVPILIRPARIGAMPRINHKTTQVMDLERSVQFYENILGLDTIAEAFRDGRHAWLSVGESAQIHLISKLNVHEIDFEDWLDNKSKISIRGDGVKQIYFKDLDTYWIEINDNYPKL